MLAQESLAYITYNDNGVIPPLAKRIERHPSTIDLTGYEDMALAFVHNDLVLTVRFSFSQSQTECRVAHHYKIMEEWLLY